MIARRVALLATIFAGLTGPGRTAEPATRPAEPGSLEHYLAGRLLVVNPRDAEFLEEVAEAVRRGDLPESLVRGTCEWAALRAIRQGVRNPFPSFRKALEIKARRLGVEF